MVNIIQDFIPKGRKNRPGHAMQAKYITIHETGNSGAGADAKAHAGYAKGGAVSVPASWHFTVDGGSSERKKLPEIYQHLPLTESGYHAGDGSGPGNRQSIGIEICMNSDGNRAKAEENAAWLTAKLIREVASLLPFPGCIRQHWHWSGKNCPQVLRARPGGWEGFLKQVESFLKGSGFDMKTAIVINSFVDFPAIEPLAKRLDAPIYLREGCGTLDAETVIVAGGDASLFRRVGVEVVDLGGGNRWETAAKVGTYYKNLK